MISAPERTTEVNTESHVAAPRVRTQGHLALVNWAAPMTPTQAPTIDPMTVKPQFLKDPIVKSATDRWFERSIFLLMASSVAAIGACFLHL